MNRAAGIDISHWKSPTDWDQIYSSGVSFVGMKATEGNSYVDPKLRLHREEFRRRPFLLGIYYHFARSGVAERQAERLMDVVGDLRPNERLALDLEVSPTIDPLQALDWTERFISTLVGSVCSDRRPILYTSKRIWRTIGDPDWGLASEVDLWAPRYNAAGAEPAMPKPWEKTSWTFWQWTDGEFPRHVTPGVGKCDANWFRGTRDELREYAAIR